MNGAKECKSTDGPCSKFFLTDALKQGPRALWESLQSLIQNEQTGESRVDDETMLIWKREE